MTQTKYDAKAYANKNSNYDKRKKLRRQKARRRKRIRQTISVSIFALIFIFIFSKIFSAINKPKDEISPALMWYYANEINKDRPRKYYYDPEYISNVALDPLLRMEDEFIVKGSNHLKKADKYAYDTKEIRQYIKKNNYGGDKKIVFLTFDDGPNNTITPQVLDILKKENVRATFFLVGKSIGDKTAGQVRKILRNGNAIATHSFSHDYDYLYPGRVVSPERVYEEIAKTNERLKNILGPDFHSSVFRYPGGEMSWQNTEASNDLLESKGIHWIDWNSLVGDAEKKSVRPTTVNGFVSYLDKSLNENKNTKIAVVLAHDAMNKQLTADSLSSVIKYFKDRGYEFGVLK